MGNHGSKLLKPTCQVIVCGCLLATLLALAGCHTVGRDFKEERRRQIVKGETTKAQIRALFGRPSEVREKADGEETWIYRYAVAYSALVVTKGKGKGLKIDFDRAGVVSDYEYRTKRK